MTIDEALKIVLGNLNSILIPASESAKMEAVKSSIQGVITAVQKQRMLENAEKEGSKHADDHDQQRKDA